MEEDYKFNPQTEIKSVLFLIKPPPPPPPTNPPKKKEKKRVYC